jgi:hypothetical protein
MDSDHFSVPASSSTRLYLHQGRTTPFHGAGAACGGLARAVPITYSVADYIITYSVVILSYDNYYTNLRDYSNSLLCDLL